MRQGNPKHVSEEERIFHFLDSKLRDVDRKALEIFHRPGPSDGRSNLRRSRVGTCYVGFDGGWWNPVVLGQCHWSDRRLIDRDNFGSTGFGVVGPEAIPFRSTRGRHRRCAWQPSIRSPSSWSSDSVAMASVRGGSHGRSSTSVRLVAANHACPRLILGQGIVARPDADEAIGCGAFTGSAGNPGVGEGARRNLGTGLNAIGLHYADRLDGDEDGEVDVLGERSQAVQRRASRGSTAAKLRELLPGSLLGCCQVPKCLILDLAEGPGVHSGV